VYKRQDDASVGSFIPERDFNIIDFDKPIGIGPIATQDNYIKYRYKAMQAMGRSKEVIEEVSKEYSTLSGREQHGLIEFYRCDDADYIIVAMGAWAGDARVAVDELRSKGISIGLAKLRVVRPFPKEKLMQVRDRKALIVLDRAYSYGFGGILATEVKASLYNANIPIYSVIGGIGGKELGKNEIIGVVEKLLSGKLESEVWLL